MYPNPASISKKIVPCGHSSDRGLSHGEVEVSNYMRNSYLLPVECPPDQGMNPKSMDYELWNKSSSLFSVQPATLYIPYQAIHTISGYTYHIRLYVPYQAIHTISGYTYHIRLYIPYQAIHTISGFKWKFNYMLQLGIFIFRWPLEVTLF